MQNIYDIEWSDEALYNLSAIVHYLETNWTEREIENFFHRIDNVLNLIAKNPLLFSLTNKRKNVRRCVLSKQTSIYYKFENDKIFLITLFDNRQAPKKLKV